MRKICLFFALLISSLIFPLSATNRALVVGIGKYMPNSGWIEINGDNDIDLIVPSLTQNGFSSKNIKTLRNSEATKQNIKNGLTEIANQSKSGDTVYFHFSGHGQRVKDFNEDEEKGVFDQSIVPYDAMFDSRRGYNGNKHLIDDELAPLLNSIKAKIGKTGTLVVVVDACYSQGIDKGDDWDELEYDEDIVYHPRGTNDKFIPNDTSWLKSISRPKEFSAGGTMYIVSASRSSEMNFQYRDRNSKRVYGSLSYCVSNLLKTQKPFSEWAKYFNINKEWKNTSPKIFPYQTPSVKVVN